MEEEIPEKLPEDPWYKGPIKYIIMIFLILLLVMWFFPAYSVKIDPEPSKIVSLSELPLEDIQLNETQKYNLKNKNDLTAFINSNDPKIKQIATRIAAISCDGSKICHAKALYYFVRDNIKYVSDPVNFEYVEDPKEVLVNGGGDCESGTILLASLMQADGISSQIVLIPNHAFLRIKLDNALRRYKAEDGYIYLDWTCSDCEFGELPLSDKVDNIEVVG